MRRQQEVGLLSKLVEAIAGDTADLFILFVDLCGSTEYKRNCIASKQPDFTWITRQLIFLQRAAAIIQKRDGTVVKTIGDEVLAVFAATTDPRRVLKCAIEVVQAYENLKGFQGPSKIDVKASLDFGLTYNGSIVESVKFDPIGLPVDRCARLNNIARNNEIVFSEAFFSAVRGQSSKRDFLRKYGCEEDLADLKGVGKTKYYTIVANNLFPSEYV
jgi:class 3 adenylate cyclase